MQLVIDPPVPYITPAGRLHVVLVGCGGTGSHLAQSLARLAAHLREQGSPIDLTFIDGDAVERKNVGRQLFSPADVGQNKAMTLAARFGMLFGLNILAQPEMASVELLDDLLVNNTRPSILIGAVDTGEARTILRDALERRPWHLWLDCGNHESAGQVCAGKIVYPAKMAGAFALGGMCAAMPAPSLIHPSLLTPAPPRPREDCAAAMQDNAQSLMVNQAIAAVAGEYLYQILAKRRLTLLSTAINLSTLSMRSTPLTAANVAQLCDLPLEMLTTLQERKAA